jgi:hypothetical protein
MTFVFYPANSPEPVGFIQEPDIVYVPVKPDGSVTTAVEMDKGDRFYVIHDKSPVQKLIKSYRKPNRVGMSQLRGNW